VAGRLLAERDERILTALREAGLGARTLGVVRKHLAQYREARQPRAEVPRRLGLSEGGHALLQDLRQRRLAEWRAEASSLLERLAAVQTEWEDQERAEAATPD
jgi:hypothetical protein